MTTTTPVIKALDLASLPATESPAAFLMGKIEELQRDLAAAQSVERERCAKIVEQYSVEIDGMPGTSRSLKPLADVIRSGQ